MDPDLGRSLPAERRSGAARDLVAAVVSLVPGAWAEAATLAEPGALGLLVLNGLVIRSVGRPGRRGAELLGPGDLLRPWQERESGSLDFDATWSVVEPTQIAVLDEAFVQQVCGYPEVIDALVARVTQRARTLAVSMAIAQEPTVEARLELVLWHLADRYGRVRTNGVIVPLMLTHSVLARLVAARRPSTTTALGRLSQRGILERVVDGWLLTGRPPLDMPSQDGVPPGG